MSFDPPAYLTSLQNSIRARPIPWEGVVRAGTITDQDLKRIKAVDKIRPEKRKEVVSEKTQDYVDLLLGGKSGKSVLESAMKRVDVTQYLLVLTGDLLKDAPELGVKLLQHDEPYAPFIPLLTYSSNPEDPVPLLTSSVLSTLAAIAQTKLDKTTLTTDHAITSLYKYLSSLAKSSDSGLQDIAVQQYSIVLLTNKARKIFWEQHNRTVSPLVDILSSAAGSIKDSDSTIYSGTKSIRSSTDAGLAGGIGLQLLYHILLVLWQLTFEAKSIGEDLQQEYEIIPLYTQLLRLSPKEKTTRLLLSTLLNLFNAHQTSSLPIAISAQLPSILALLKKRHLTDQDLLEDLDSITKILDDYTSSQTTFDEYAAEIMSEHLRWSPPHRDANFWSENAEKIVIDNHGQIVKKLATILAKAWEDNKTVLAVACNDVGRIVSQCPEKREFLEKLGIKVRVMELMNDTDEHVRWESLRTIGGWLRYSFDR